MPLEGVETFDLLFELLKDIFIKLITNPSLQKRIKSILKDKRFRNFIEFKLIPFALNDRAIEFFSSWRPQFEEIIASLEAYPNISNESIIRVLDMLEAFLNELDRPSSFKLLVPQNDVKKKSLKTFLQEELQESTISVDFYSSETKNVLSKIELPTHSMFSLLRKNRIFLTKLQIHDLELFHSRDDDIKVGQFFLKS